MPQLLTTDVRGVHRGSRGLVLHGNHTDAGGEVQTPLVQTISQGVFLGGCGLARCTSATLKRLTLEDKIREWLNEGGGGGRSVCVCVCVCVEAEGERGGEGEGEGRGGEGRGGEGEGV